MGRRASRWMTSLPPPELIIQDELHLISGPLGTIAGLYETAIDHLCRDTQGRSPKIVSSTATVRRADRADPRLVRANSVQIFPPPGPDRRDSFFAGTLPPAGARRGATWAWQLRAAAPSGSPEDVPGSDVGRGQAVPRVRRRSVAENPADPYMTMLGYFNSLRELGGTRSAGGGRGQEPPEPVRQAAADR